MPWWGALLLFSTFCLPVVRFPGLGHYVEPVRACVLVIICIGWIRDRIAVLGVKAFLARLGKQPLCAWAVIMLAWIALSTTLSTHLSTSLVLLTVQAMILSYFFLYLDVFREMQYVRGILAAALISGFLVAAIAILQFVVVNYGKFTFLERWIIPGDQRVFLQTGEGELIKESGYRSVGTFFHHNLLGTYLAFLFPFAITIAGFVRDRINKAALLVLVLMLAAGIFCSGSRGAILSLGVSTLFLTVVYWKKIHKGMILLMVILGVTGAMLFAARIGTFLRFEQGLTGRDVIWQRALEIYETSPWVGIGSGVFPELFVARYGFASELDLMRALGEFDSEGNLNLMTGFTAHNFFLNSAVEMGFIGAMIVICLYLTYFWLFYGYFSRAQVRDGFKWNIMMAATAAIAGNFFQAFFEAYFWNISLGMTFAWVASLGLSVMCDQQETG